jgi:hypothetical protein
MSLETGTYISDLVATNPLATDPKSQGDDHLRFIKSTLLATFPNVTGAVTPTHTELNYVDGVTSSIQTQLDTKGAIAGQAWTGTHTFVTQTVGDNSTKVATTAYVDGNFGRITGQAWTGSHTFPTQSAGDNSTKVATTAYVDQTAFSTALPAQSGNSGKFLTTDGTDASWTNITNLASAKSANYTVVATDRYKSFDLTSSATLSLTAAVTLGNGFVFYVRNTSTGRWLIDPNSSETIDGRTSIYVYPGEGFAIICDGTNWRTFGRARVVLINSTTISGGPAQIDFETGFDDSEFASFEFQWSVALSPTGPIFGRVKKSGTYAATNYVNTSSGSGVQIDLMTATNIVTNGGIVRVAGAGATGAAGQTITVETSTNSATNSVVGVAAQIGTGFIEGFRFAVASGGAFGSGAIKFYGVRG